MSAGYERGGEGGRGGGGIGGGMVESKSVVRNRGGPTGSWERTRRGSEGVESGANAAPSAFSGEACLDA